MVNWTTADYPFRSPHVMHQSSSSGFPASSSNAGFDDQLRRAPGKASSFVSLCVAPPPSGSISSPSGATPAPHLQSIGCPCSMARMAQGHSTRLKVGLYAAPPRLCQKAPAVCSLALKTFNAMRNDNVKWCEGFVAQRQCSQCMGEYQAPGVGGGTPGGQPAVVVQKVVQLRREVPRSPRQQHVLYETAFALSGLRCSVASLDCRLKTDSVVAWLWPAAYE